MLRINARISYHSRSCSVRPLSDSYCAIVPSRSGKPSRCWPSSDRDRRLERGEPRHVVLGRADRRHVPVEHRARREIVAEDHVAEPNVAPQQDGFGLGRGSVRATPVERVDERGERAHRRSTSRGSRPRSRARPRCRVRERRPRPRDRRDASWRPRATNASCTCARWSSVERCSHGSSAATSPMMCPRTRGITTNGAPSHCGSVTSSGVAIATPAAAAASCAIVCCARS